jgi:hypothetical protein
VSFNAYISPPPATHDSDLRAGAKLGPTDLSFFIKKTRRTSIRISP